MGTMAELKFPDEYQLDRPSGYFDKPDNPAAVKYCKERNALFNQAMNGTLYIKFVDGDRKGSIARLTIDPRYKDYFAAVERTHSYYSDPVRYTVNNAWFYGIAKWDKRKNKCQVTVPSDEIVFLPNYQGPTVYELFDRKAAKEELLKNPEQEDIDGNVLAIGDKVLYINARYGSGVELCHGTIKEFKVVADSKGHSFTTVVEKDGGDEESSISYPFQMIWKKP